MSSICEFNGIKYEIKDEQAIVLEAAKNITEAEILNSVAYEGKAYPVTSIAKGAFCDCSELISAVIPKSVKSIERGAFVGCCKLESITLPFVGSDNTVGRETLFGHIFGASVYERAYEGDRYYGTDDIMVSNNNNDFVPKSLKTVIITNEALIGKQAFKGCDNITSIEIPNTVIGIEEGAFERCGSLTSIVLPDSVKYIADEAFNYCVSLKSVKIGNGLTKIYNRAFCNCTSLSDMEIPESITSVSENAFDFCQSLHYNEYDNVIYLGNSKNPYVLLIRARDKDITSCKIHDKAKVICKGAFAGCVGITEIEIPMGVTTIGSDAFSRCKCLVRVVIPNSVTRIDSFAFDYCANLSEMVIPTSVEYIGTCAFRSCGTIYLEATEPSPNWDRNWNYSNYHTVFGYGQDN